MEIQFQSTGENSGFENWLKGFKEISDSLLIEIDTASQQFVAKVFSNGRDVVKYGKLDFSDAGLEVTGVKDKSQKKISLEEWNAQNEGKRIFFPILKTLKKFIEVVSLFKGSENYKLNVKFTESDDRLLVSKAEFKSLALTMNVGSSELTEFADIITKLTDDNFRNKVSAIPNPMTFTVIPDALKTLFVASNIYSNDPKKDILSFQTKKVGDAWALYAVDHSNGIYNYNLGFMNQECENPVETALPIVRENLITAAKNDAESLVITLEGMEGAEGKKVRIDSGSKFITIIASVVTE